MANYYSCDLPRNLTNLDHGVVGDALYKWLKKNVNSCIKNLQKPVFVMAHDKTNKGDDLTDFWIDLWFDGVRPWDTRENMPFPQRVRIGVTKHSSVAKTPHAYVQGSLNTPSLDSPYMKHIYFMLPAALNQLRFRPEQHLQPAPHLPVPISQIIPPPPTESPNTLKKRKIQNKKN